MELQIHFAKPVSIYNNFLNKCAGKYCHCEVSVELTTNLLRAMIETAISNAYSPSYLEKVLKKLTTVEGKVKICFYILWNDVVSIRFFNNLGNDFYNPTEEVYDTVSLQIPTVEKLKDFIVWNLCQVGKPYDLARALCLFLPLTIRTENPQKFFCSQLVMHGLENIGYKVDQDINHMKPDDVYNWLTIKADDHTKK